MQIALVVIPTVLGSILVSFVLWEYLVKKGGGTVILDEKSWLMQKWTALNPNKDPRNICEMIQVIWGHRRLIHQILMVVNAVDSPQRGVRIAARIGFSLFAVILITLFFGFAILDVRGIVLLTQQGKGLMALYGGLILVAIITLLSTMIWFLTRPFVRGKIVSIWLGLCPPVQVKRAVRNL